MRRFRAIVTVMVVGLLLAACSDAEPEPDTSTTAPPPPDTTTSAVPLEAPNVLGVAHPPSVDAHAMAEFEVELEASYSNPYDQREVRLNALLTGPDGKSVELPGFWDGEEAWRLRFTPTTSGDWSYSVTVSDHRGISEPAKGSIAVDPADHPGFLRIGNQIDSEYSSRYFAYEDGTPWYGRGHADLDMSLGGADANGDGLRKFSEMVEIGENYEMWWPMWGNNYIQETYDDYSPAQMNIIDFVLRDAENKGIAIVYTIWGHQFLRTADHDWPDDRWNFNGFSELTDLAGFFTDPEAWAWQENYYRYIIARWSYSPAIVMWQTVTEINGTESYDETNPWHEKVDAYFQENDPYRHPTTATMSGARDWPEGHAVMDVPQVHLYHIFGENPIADTVHFVEWTRLMWNREEKPNWVGEYGNRVQNFYPEFMHNANWASLAAGAALTPTEWNDLNAFGRFDEEMEADMARFAEFTDALPLVVYDPETVGISSSDPEVRAWGLAGESGGVLWAQDFALEDATIDEIRADTTVRNDVHLTVDALEAGTWTLTPYNTWTGEWLTPIQVACPGGPCDLPLPGFTSDIAIHLER